MTTTRSLRDVAKPRSLKDVASLRSGKTPARSRQKYWNGAIPWFSAKDLKCFRLLDSIEHISKFAVESGAPIAKTGHVLILVRGMMLLKDAPVGLLAREASFNQDIKALEPKSGIRGDYLAYFLAASKSRIRSMVDLAGHGTGRLAIERLVTLPVWVPPDEIQSYLCERLELLDTVILRYGELIDAKSAQKCGLIQQMLTGQKRFPEFRYRPWAQRKLGDYFTVKAIRNSDRAVDLVYSCTKTVGIIPQAERFGKRLASADLGRYKVVAPGDLVYDPMLLWDGSIGFVSAKSKGVVSPAYATFQVVDSVNREFFWPLLKSYNLIHRYKQISQGTNTRRRKAQPKDFLRLTVPMPPTQAEQDRIGAVLTAAQREIDVLEQLRDRFEAYKRGLLARLLSGELQVPDS